MEETEKIWFNGELVDWADAKIHVGCHGLHYGAGVFEGIRAYETERGPAVFRLTDHMKRLEMSAKLIYMRLPHSVEELVQATHDVVAANGLPRATSGRSRSTATAPWACRARQPGVGRDHELAVGDVPRRRRARQGHPR